jgi:hypothetical protein
MFGEGDRTGFRQALLTSICDPLVGVLQAFAVFFVGFLGRPIGHGALGPLVSQFEGTLDQFSGDGIWCFSTTPTVP